MEQKNPPDSKFCGKCGTEIGKTTEKATKRPAGLIVASILLFIWGGLDTLVGVLVLPAWFYFLSAPAWLLPHGRLGLFLEITVTIYILVVGIGSLSLGYGLWKRKLWAREWSYRIAFSIIGQVLIYWGYYRVLLIEGSIIVLLLIIFMIYIGKPGVKAYLEVEKHDN